MPIQSLRKSILIVSALAMCCLMFSATTADAGKLPRYWEIDPAEAGLRKPSETIDSLPGSNNIVDIVYSAPDVWVASGKGPSRITLPGNQWTTYDTTDGLPSTEIPSIAVFPNGVWTATSHTEAREGGLVTWGDGIYRFNDASGTWDRRTPAGDQASGPFQVVYDFAYYRGRVIAACFAGGLVSSSDDGVTWDNIFADNTARSDFENEVYNDLNNRYFAAVVDSTRPESLAVWAGTAYGINKFVFLNDTLKPKGIRFNDLFIDGTHLYAATENGLSLTTDRGGSWRTFNTQSDGLPSNIISAVGAVGDTIWAGFLKETDTSLSEGIAYTTNEGNTWSEFIFPHVLQDKVVDIIVTKTHVWVAKEGQGVFRSTHLNPTYELVWGGRANSILLVPGVSDSLLYIGTDDGIAVLPTSLSSPAVEFSVGMPADTLGQRVIALGYQPTPCGPFTHAIWALTEPDFFGGTPGFAASADSGQTWDVSSRRFGVRDVVFEGCRFWLATDSGLAEGHILNLDSLMFTASYKTLVTNKRVGPTPLSLAAELGQDASGNPVISALWVGTDSLLARSLDKGITWAVVFSNPDPVDFDLLEFFRYRDDDTSVAGFEQLSGNFITAIGFQPGGRGAIWAATQATGQGRFANTFIGAGEKDGLSVTRDAGKTWSVPLTGHQVWNFAFDGAIVWAASSQGLLRSPNNGVTWDTLDHFVDPESGAVIDSTVEVFAVEIVGNEVWVGTENGMVILDRNANLISVRRTFKEVAESEPGSEGGVYATPVPFSPNISPGGIRFHYVPPVSGPVTIRIYDYANNLVKTVTDAAQREAGRQYDESDTWDGRNGAGNVVAVGTYFFVIEYSGGDTHWGKLVVIP